MALLNLIVTLTLLFVTIETKEELNLDDASAIVGEKFDYEIGNEAFISTYKIYRIVQRGQRKLPSWLTFDTNSSMLIGYPKREDVGMYTIRMRAQCIDPTVSNCQDKLSRTFHINVIEPLISAESRGRKKTISKHGKKEKWKLTNMHNGNAGLIMEYDISRHGTVVENQPGMLDSGSKHVLSYGVLYSAMQFDNVAKYFSNKNMHDKLSSNSYLVMQYNSASINFLPLSDIHKQFSSIVTNYPSMPHHSFTNNVHMYNSDVLSISSSVLYSSMQYDSRIDTVLDSDRSLQHSMMHDARDDSVQYSDKVKLLKSESFLSVDGHDRIHNSELYEMFTTDTDMFYKSTLFQDTDLQSQGAKTSKVLLSTKQSVLTNKRFDEEKSEESINSDTAALKADHSRSKSIQNRGSLEYGVPNLCPRDQTNFYASLILHVRDILISTQENILIHKWSNFVSKDHDLIFISRTKSNDKGLMNDGKFILTAGPGNVIESLSNSVELSWHLACNVFEQLEDFTRVIQHNIEVGRVSKEIGFDVIAWFVYTDRPLPKRVRRQAHSRRRQTATPTYSPPVPTTLSEIFSTTFMDSSLLSVSLSFSSKVSTTYLTSSSSFAFLLTSIMSVLPSATQHMSSSPLSSSQPSSTFTFSETSTLVVTTFESTFFSVSNSSFAILSASISNVSSFSTSTSFISPSFPSLLSSLPIIISTSLRPSPSLSLTQVSSSPTITVFTTSSSSSFFTDTILISSSTMSSIISTSARVSSFPSFFTSSLSFSSAEADSTSFVISFISPLDTSSIFTPSPTSKFSTNSSSLSEDFSSSMSELSITSFTFSESFQSSLILELSSSMYSSMLSIPSTSVNANSSTPSHSFRSAFESSLSLTSFLLSTSFSFLSSTLTEKPSDFSSELSSFSSELSTFSSDTSFSKTLFSSVLSSYSVPITSSDSEKYLFTSNFPKSSTIETFKTRFPSSSLTFISLPMSYSEDISISATSLVSLALTSRDFITSTRSVITSPALKTTLIPVLSTSSLLSESSYSKDVLSSRFSSFMLVETFTSKSLTELITSSYLSSAVVPSTDILSSTISSLSSIEILSPTPSSSFERSSRSELKPSLPEYTSSDSFSTISLMTGTLETAFQTSTIPSTLLDTSINSTTVPTRIISPTRVSETFSLTSLSSTRVVTTAAPDESPKLEKSIDHLNVVIGRYFEYQIPEDTFSDKEDGNTRNLTLRLSLTYSKPFPKSAWLLFNKTLQTFYGIPLQKDAEGRKKISEFTLIAKDSKGQVAKDAISLTYEYERNLNHKIGMTLNGSYEKFSEDREQLIQVARNIADLYEDENLNFLSFSDVEKGSVVIIWSNNSLTRTPCQKGAIQNLYDRLTDDNGTISDQFITAFRDNIPVNTSLEFLGACLLPITSIAPPTKSPVTETDNKMWIEIVLPALIAILVIVIIALLLLICCRHRRPSKEIKDSDKPAFLEDRRPIIFPDELEMVDPSLKPKTPLVLPSDYLNETPPAVPPHGREAPPYRPAVLDDDRFIGDDEDQPIPPSYRGDSQNTEPPPYRLPPPYFNPHRMA